MSRKRIIVILGMLCLLLVGVSLLNGHRENLKSSNVTIELNLPDETGLRVTANGSSLSVLSSLTTFKLVSGSYIITFSKPSYTTFATRFTIDSGQTTILNVTMKRTTQTPINNWQQIQGSYLYPAAIITRTTYFYQETWAVSNIEIGGDSGVVVTHYNDSTKTWQLILGPGTSFSESSIGEVPVGVNSYIQNNDLVQGGS